MNNAEREKLDELNGELRRLSDAARHASNEFKNFNDQIEKLKTHIAEIELKEIANESSTPIVRIKMNTNLPRSQQE